MPEITTLGIWITACLLMAWMVRTLMKHVEDCRAAAAQSHILAVLERERCERIAAECREVRSECQFAASVAHDAAADAEEYAESVEPLDDNPFDDDDDDVPYR